ncbi:protein polyglycylase TTLL10 [Conger conger]|uniref:protein polyglycylase TTLL10 n=1 Tax=Conger conger TaxID=82655 RepID=UPI002A599021|nr:protein polyglycylase TTLL10 [Conger conger]
MGSSDIAPSDTTDGMSDVMSDRKVEQREAAESTEADENVAPQKWPSAPEQKCAQAIPSRRGSQALMHKTPDDANVCSINRPNMNRNDFGCSWSIVPRRQARNQESLNRSQDDRLQREHRRSPSRAQRGEVPLQGCVRDRNRRTEEVRGPGPFFFIGGGNGAAVVASYCESQGWQRIHDRTREDYKLKWCEIKSKITYYNFREGEQLLFQIPNNRVLTTKIGLLCSLREYERVSSKVNYGRGMRRLKMEEFFPETFRMDIRDERDAFFALQKAGAEGGGRPQAWICKPTGLNQGRGIFLLRTEEEVRAFQAQLLSTEENHNYRRPPFRLPQARIVQRYIENPLLLKGRKFDVRSYFLIACTTPYMVFFRHGYVRLTCEMYDPNSNNLSAHLTNQYMQKKNPLYNALKEETVWSMERFNAYVNEQFREAKALPQDWVLGAFTKRMQVIVSQCFLAVKAKLERKLGLFDLIGCDFMIDEDFKVWLLEMNCNPALHTNCQALKEVVPSAVNETLDLALEIFSKCRSGQKLLPLASQRNFVLLYGAHCIPDHRSRTPRPFRMLHQKTPRTQRAANEAANGRSLPAPTAQAPPTHPPKPAENRRPVVVKVPKPRGTWLPLPKPLQLGTWDLPSDTPWVPRPAVQNRGRSIVLSLSTPGLGGESGVSIPHLRESSASLQKERRVNSCLKSTQLPVHRGHPRPPGEEEQHGATQ